MRRELWSGFVSGHDGEIAGNRTANKSKRDHSNSLEEAVINGEQRQRERTTVLRWYPETLGYDREDNDDHACEGKGARFRQLR
jgi:hypothetical protein